MAIDRDIKINIRAEDNASKQINEVSATIEKRLLSVYRSVADEQKRSAKSQLNLNDAIRRSNLSLNNKKRILSAVKKEQEGRIAYLGQLSKAQRQVDKSTEGNTRTFLDQVAIVIGLDKLYKALERSVQDTTDAITAQMISLAKSFLFVVSSLAGIVVIDKTLEYLDSTISKFIKSFRRYRWQYIWLERDLQASIGNLGKPARQAYIAQIKLTNSYVKTRKTVSESLEEIIKKIVNFGDVEKSVGAASVSRYQKLQLRYWRFEDNVAKVFDNLKKKNLDFNLAIKKYFGEINGYFSSGFLKQDLVDVQTKLWQRLISSYKYVAQESKIILSAFGNSILYLFSGISKQVQAEMQFIVSTLFRMGVEAGNIRAKLLRPDEIKEQFSFLRLFSQYLSKSFEIVSDSVTRLRYNLTTQLLQGHSVLTGFTYIAIDELKRLSKVFYDFTNNLIDINHVRQNINYLGSIRTYAKIVGDDIVKYYKSIGATSSALGANLITWGKTVVKASPKIIFFEDAARQDRLVAKAQDLMEKIAGQLVDVGKNMANIPLSIFRINLDNVKNGITNLDKTLRIAARNSVNFKAILNETANTLKFLKIVAENVGWQFKNNFSAGMIEILTHGTSFKVLNLGRLFLKVAHRSEIMGQGIKNIVNNFENLALVQREAILVGRQFIKTLITIANAVLIAGGSIFHTFHGVVTIVEGLGYSAILTTGYLSELVERGFKLVTASVIDTEKALKNLIGASHPFLKSFITPLKRMMKDYGKVLKQLSALSEEFFLNLVTFLDEKVFKWIHYGLNGIAAEGAGLFDFFHQLIVGGFGAVKDSVDILVNSVTKAFSSFGASLAGANSTVGAMRTNTSTLLKLRFGDAVDAMSDSTISFGKALAKTVGELNLLKVNIGLLMTSGLYDFIEAFRNGIRSATSFSDGLEKVFNNLKRVGRKNIALWKTLWLDSFDEISGYFAVFKKNFNLNFIADGGRGIESLKSIGVIIRSIAIQNFNSLVASFNETSKSFTYFLKNLTASKANFLGFIKYVRIEATLAFYQLTKWVLKLGTKGLLALKDGLHGVKNALSTISLREFSQLIQSSFKSLSNTVATVNTFSTGVLRASKHTEFFQKGLAGVSARAFAFGSIFNGLGVSLLKADSTMAKMAGGSLVALGVALGGLTFLIQEALIMSGGLIAKLGQKLTNATYGQIKAFQEGEKTTYAFEQTLSSYSESADQAAKKIDKWTKYVNKSSEATGQTKSTLRALVAETVGATKAFGLADDQMEQLIDRSIDLSERAHKPAIETLTALINAMNGNTAGLAIYGLHLNKVSIQKSKLNQATKDNFDSLDDISKGQARYNVLMEQAGLAANYATNNADLYTKSTQVQKNAITQLNEGLGKGSAIINGPLTFGLATVVKILTAMAAPFLPLIGFMQAITGRLLEWTGGFLQHYLTVLIVITSYKALNVLLNHLSKNGFFLKTIPLINKSLTELITGTKNSTTELNSIGKVLKALFFRMRNDTRKAIKDLLFLDQTAELSLNGVKTKLSGASKRMLHLGQDAQLTGRAILIGLGGRAKQGLGMLKVAFLAALPAVQGFVAGLWGMVKAAAAFVVTPVGAVVTLVAGVMVVLYKAVTLLEEKTQIFSKTWETLSNAFAISIPLLDRIKKEWSGFFSLFIQGFTGIVEIAAGSIAYIMENVLRMIRFVGKASQIFKAFAPSLAMSTKAIDELSASIDQMDQTATEMWSNGANKLINALMGTAHASDVVNHSLSRIPVAKLMDEIEKLEATAKDAFTSISNYTPQLNLQKLEKETKKYKDQFKTLDKRLKAAHIAIVMSGENEKELAIVEQKIRNLTEAMNALTKQHAIRKRKIELDAVKLRLEDERNLIVTQQHEEDKLKRDHAESMRNHRIEQLKLELLAKRNLVTLDQQTGITEQQAAMMAANEMEMNAFKAKLDTQRKLAVDNELLKRQEIANLAVEKAQANDVGTHDSLLAKQQAEFAQLEAQKKILIQQGVLEEKNAIIQLRDFKQQQKVQESEFLIAQHQAQAEMLGTSPEGLQKNLELAQQNEILRRQKMMESKEWDLLTEQEQKVALQQLELEHQLNLRDIKEGAAQAEIDLLKRQGKYIEARYKEDNLKFKQNQREKGLIQAIFEDNRFKASMTFMSNLQEASTLFGQKGFKFAQKIAEVKAYIDAIQGAQAAFTSLAGIPIVGPGLATAAAAAALAAGYARVRQIRNQKPPQAHAGLDYVPKGASNSTFLLKEGERVIAPRQNKDLTDYLDKSKDGGKGHTFVFNNYGTADAGVVDTMFDKFKDMLREASERGEPVINKAGVVG